MSLKGKTLFITGGSRGIGLAIALKAAADGANVAIAAKTVDPHSKLEGTIHTAAAEIEKAGGKALALAVDVREEAAVKAALDQTAAHFGGIDIVVNNASAIQLTPVAQTDMRRFDLMHQINARGTFMVSKYALPHLHKSESPHILMLSPPLDMKEKWFAPAAGYAMAKFGMSLVVLGLAGEQRGKIAVNALWPRTTIPSGRTGCARSRKSWQNRNFICWRASKRQWRRKRSSRWFIRWITSRRSATPRPMKAKAWCGSMPTLRCLPAASRPRCAAPAAPCWRSTKS